MNTANAKGVGATIRGWCRVPFDSVASRLRTAPYLVKWIVLGCLIGSAAGLGAVAFVEMLHLGTYLFLQLLGSYDIPEVAAEGGSAGSVGYLRAWAIPLIVALGALLAGLLVNAFAPEAEGHGTDAAIDTVHRHPREVRLRTVLVKMVASAITLGSGGSGGREGPAAQISSGFGSLLTRVLDLPQRDGRLAVSIGIGAGIGSIFSAPLGGALLSAEILYRDDTEVEAVVPSLLASGVGYTIFGSIEGFNPMFGFEAADYNFSSPGTLGWYALIGVVAGGIGLLYSRTFHGLKALFARIPGPAALRPALGGLLTGLIALFLPQVLGTGYGWIQQGLDNNLASLPLALVIALPVAKILTTSLSIGSGGSGGIFGPGMVIGAFTGLAVWRVLEPFAPAIPDNPAPFVIVGMMACFGPICRAPLAVMLMVGEMTASITTMIPALIAVGVSYLIVHHFGETIYRSQPGNRADRDYGDPGAEADEQRHAPEADALPVSDVMAPAKVLCDSGDTVGETIDTLAEHQLPGAPVTDDAGTFLGVVSGTRLEQAAVGDGKTAIEEHLLTPPPPAMHDDDQLSTALDSLLESRRTWLPVIDEREHVAGVLTLSSVLRGYGMEPPAGNSRSLPGPRGR